MEKKEVKEKKKGENPYQKMSDAIGLNNVETKNKPTLIISAECHNHILELHKEYMWKEWLAWCKTENLWGWKFKIVDMLHPQQTASSGEVETTDDWMLWLLEELVKRQEPRGQWNLVLHSHNQMRCFRSWTDDQARLGLNDGRKLAWAVVTNYQWGKVWYKWCVNFYKPYPIEIDAIIEVEDRDFSWEYEALADAFQGYKETRNDLIDKKYDEKLDTSEEVKTFTCSYPLDDIYSYLWIDVKEELEKNKKEILEKLPCECKEFRELLKKIKEEVTVEVDKEIGAFDISWSEDVIAWGEWHEWLMKQMKEALVEKKYYNNAPITSWDKLGKLYSQYDDEEYAEGMTDAEKELIEKKEMRDEYEFNRMNFPSRDELIYQLELPPRTYVRCDDTDWLWYVRDHKEWDWEYLWDVIDEIYNNEYRFAF